MNLYNAAKQEIEKILVQLQQDGHLPSDVAVSSFDVMPPREEGHGDMATNAAMVLAGKMGKKPRELAELLKEKIETLPDVMRVEIAGPGFINLTFQPHFWHQIVTVIQQEGNSYGNSLVGEGQKINIEYVSANPTGPMHVGHARGAVYGDALSTLLIKAGFNVTKEYYINDAGGQIDKLAQAAALRYLEALGGKVTQEDFAGLYPGDYLIAVGEALKTVYGDKFIQKNAAQEYELRNRKEWLPIIREFATDSMMALIREDLQAIGIEHDVFTSEYKLAQSGAIEEALGLLEQKGLIYRGILEAPKGKTPDDWEPREQTLFKSTLFGDDCDRAIQKSDGSWTYFAPDIAYHYDKIKRGFTRMVDVLGADHGGYAKRIQSAVKALSNNEAQLEVKLCQMVKLMRSGEMVKMSKRNNTLITTREVVDEVGKSVFRFIMLMRKNDAALDFDFEKVTEQSKENPVFYVQYAHARAKSVLRMAREEMGVAWGLSQSATLEHLATLESREELFLLKLMAAFPRQIEAAALAYEPHRIAFYLHDLASAFHSLWNAGNQDATKRFIVKENQEATVARLALVRAFASVIASGLVTLGVEPMEEM